MQGDPVFTVPAPDSMGFVMPHITVVIGTGAVGLALILQIVGVATPGWIVDSAR